MSLQSLSRIVKKSHIMDMQKFVLWECLFKSECKTINAKIERCKVCPHLAWIIAPEDGCDDCRLLYKRLRSTKQRIDTSFLAEYAIACHEDRADTRLDNKKSKKYARNQYGRAVKS